MAVTLDDGTVNAEDLAEFLWAAMTPEHERSAAPWAQMEDREKVLFRDLAGAAVSKFEIYPR